VLLISNYIIATAERHNKYNIYISKQLFNLLNKVQQQLKIKTTMSLLLLRQTSKKTTIQSNNDDSNDNNNSIIVDLGVKGLNMTNRTTSLLLPSTPTTKLLQQQSSTQPTWNTDDENLLTLKHQTWKKLRQQQMKDIHENKASIKHVIVAFLIILTFRAASHQFGFQARKVAGYITLFSFLRFFWVNRAPSRTLPLGPHDFPVYPIIGQIQGIINTFRKSGVQNQLEHQKLRGYKTWHAVRFGGVRIYGLLEPEDREYMLKTNWKNFTKNGQAGEVGFQEIFAEIMGRGIFAVDGDEWQDHRKVASHMFSANALKSKMETSFIEHGKTLIELLHEKARNRQEFDFQELAQALTFDTISDIAFGSFPHAMKEYMNTGKKVDFLVRFDRVQQTCMLRVVLPEPIWKTMRWLNIGPERQIREDAVEIRNYVQKIVDERRSELNNNMNKTGTGGEDLLAMYIKTAKTSGKTYMDDNDYLNDCVLNFMIAGRDTTSSTLINLFRLLDENPRCKEMMKSELEQIVGKNRHVSWDDIKLLKYSNAVFNEVLRLKPPVTGNVKLVNQDCTFPSGLFVPAGSRVVINIAAIGRDFHLWHQPDEFLPERWLHPDAPQERISRGVDEFMLPNVNGGPRICLGRDMARLETLNIAWTILKEFDIKITPGQDTIELNGPVQFYKYGVKCLAVEVGN
jgi:cytochrome P450